MKRLQIFFLVLIFFGKGLYAQPTDTTKTKPTQYRRGIELQPGYQSYEQKYAGKNMNEEKRRSFHLQSTGTWTELNPKVPRVDYVGVFFTNKDTGWAVGDLGALIKTTDGGESWEVKETNTTLPILRVRSYNGQVVIASGYDGLILRSTDGGETFEQAASGVGSGFDLWGLEMINDTLGWACGATALLKSTDGGENWQIINTPGYTGNLWWIDFMDKNYGFIAGDGKILRTTDTGGNWEVIQAGDNQSLYSIDVIDSLHIATAGYGDTDYPAKNIYSSDGGYTWVNGGFLTTEDVNDIKYINPDSGYVIMNNVIGWKTTNRGQQWTGMTIGGEYEMQLFEEENIGYSAGTGLRIYKTENGYENWQRLIMNDNFADVFFVSEQKGFALSGFLYKTTDSGINWQRVSGAPGGSDIIFLDSLTGFIGSNLIYKTTDGGLSWYVPNGGQGGAGRIFFVNETTGWAVHSNVIYKTTDRGENWFTQFTAPLSISFSSIHFVDSLYGWTANLGGRPYKTTDGGNTWTQQTNLNIWESRDIYFKDSLNGYILESNKLYKSTDAGLTWVLNPDVTGFSIAARFNYYGDNFIFITGYTTYRTTNGGDDWEEFIELNGVRINGLCLLNEGLGYAAGEIGLIAQYYDSTNVPVELISFSASVTESKITIKWTTATETNNSGFEILRSNDNNAWSMIRFVPGNGTTTQPHSYSYSEKITLTGIYYYKLKQIDYNGEFEFSKSISVQISNPADYSLSQNYPNPFNPETNIDLMVPEETNVSIKLYDITGQEVKELLNEKKQPGYYTLKLKGDELSSGIYLYRLVTSSGYTAVKKLTIIK